jgi:hypothetical protein
LILSPVNLGSPGSLARIIGENLYASRNTSDLDHYPPLPDEREFTFSCHTDITLLDRPHFLRPQDFYLAMIPQAVPIDMFFDVLNRDSQKVRLEVTNYGEHALCHALRDKWRDLENDLISVVEYLMEYVDHPFFDIATARNSLNGDFSRRISYPFFPFCFGYRKPFHRDLPEKAIRNQIRLSRNGFRFLSALVTWAIFLVSKAHPRGSDAIPKWKEVLMSRRMPAWWVDELSRSSAGNGIHAPRIGAFVDLTKYHKEVVDLLRARVPVFYLWTAPVIHRLEYLGVNVRAFEPSSSAKNRAHQDYVDQKRLEELPSLLTRPAPYTSIPLGKRSPWAAHRYLTAVWQAIRHPFDEPHVPSEAEVQNEVLHESAAPRPQKGSGQRDGESIEAFFKRREEGREQSYRTASESKKVTYQNRKRDREGHPEPSMGTKSRFFHWMLVGESWIRTKLKKGEAIQMWEMRTNAERRYDEVEDEWDICSDWGEKRDIGEVMDEIAEDYHTYHGITHDEHTAGDFNPAIHEETTADVANPALHEEPTGGNFNSPIHEENAASDVNPSLHEEPIADDYIVLGDDDASENDDEWENVFGACDELLILTSMPDMAGLNFGFFCVVPTSYRNTSMTNR